MLPVFYLKYRPQKISELDLTEVRENLSRVLSSGAIPHALLFSGPKGLGKTSAARIVAKVINCLARTKGSFEPCNKCRICQSITQGTCLDLIEIDAASNRGIDDIRELKEKIKLSPTLAQNKVYVIDEVHMLTQEAFNALLKTLEEPPGHAFFILCTTEPEKLPATIISRCQRFNFYRATSEEVIRSLKRIVNGEKLIISLESLELISRRVDASFREAAKVLQQLVFSGKKISHKQVLALLEKEMILSQVLLQSLSTKDIALALKQINQAVAQGVDLKVLTQEILEQLHLILLAKYGLVKEKVTDYGLTIKDVMQLAQLFDEAGRNLKMAILPQLPLEIAVLEWENINKFRIKNSELRIKEKSRKPFDDSAPEKWQEVLVKIKQDNHSIEALLKSTRLKEITDQNITIEVFYEFHQRKLEAENSVQIVEKRIAEVFNKPLKIKYYLRPSVAKAMEAKGGEK